MLNDMPRYLKSHQSDVDNEAINTELDTSDDDLNSNKTECEESFNLLRWKQLGRLRRFVKQPVLVDEWLP